MSPSSTNSAQEMKQELPFELPFLLKNAQRTEGFQALYLFELKEAPKTWFLIFHHGKANEVGSAVLNELELLTQTLESPQGPQCLVSLSVRQSRSGKAIFIAGANVTERADWDDDKVKAHVRRQRHILAQLRQAPLFHICIVNGLALGWGTEFLITADYKLACSEAAFALPETGLGILPGAGGTSELSALIGAAHTLRLGMTGEMIHAQEALRIGLIQEQVEQIDQGLQRAIALAHLVSQRSPTALAAFKRGLLASIGQHAETRQELEAKAYERCVESGEAAIGRRDFNLIKSGQSPNWGVKQL